MENLQETPFVIDVDTVVMDPIPLQSLIDQNVDYSSPTVETKFKIRRENSSTQSVVFSHEVFISSFHLLINI